MSRNMAAGRGTSSSLPSLRRLSSKTLDWILLSLLLSHFCVNCATNRVYGAFDKEFTAFSPRSRNGNYRASHVFGLRRAFSKTRIAYYPNSLATYSLMRIALSGDVEPNPGMSINTGTKAKGNGGRRPCIKIAHLNVCSIKNREHYFLARDLVTKYRLDIFTVSESWLDYSISDLEVEFPGFTLHRLDRDYKTGGGVCAFVNNSFKCARLEKLSYISDSGFHQLWLKIQVQSFKSLIICTAYRTDDVPLSCFENDLSCAVTSAMSFNTPIFILADFNCNMLRPDEKEAKSLQDFCKCFNLTQVIDAPTRITQFSKSLINNYSMSARWI